MKKTIAIFTLIFALLLTTGCAASNAAQDPMTARTTDVQPAANPTEAAVNEQTEAPTEAPTKAPTEAPKDEPTPIGKDKALQIALDHAGVSAEKATAIKVEYDKEDGEYDVEFRYNNYEYDYSIHVTTGKVLKHEKEYDGPAETKSAATKATEKANQATKATEKSTKATEAAKTLIGKEKAKSIALKHAGISESKAANIKVEYDKEDKEYEVDFRAGDYEYDYTIGAYSDKVLDHDKEYDPIETKPKATEPKPTEAAAKTVIGKDKAKSIALKHAGISESKATNLVVQYDKEDKEYEVDFRAGDYEYEYTIGAYSGKVLEHDKEYDPIETKPKETQPKETELIGKSKAKSIALKHAGFSADEVSGLEVEYDKDDGVPVYEVEFHKGNKEYSYEIHGETGKILSYEIDD